MTNTSRTIEVRLNSKEETVKYLSGCCNILSGCALWASCTQRHVADEEDKASKLTFSEPVEYQARSSRWNLLVSPWRIARQIAI